MKMERADISVFTERLRTVRKERGLTMDDFCNRFNEMHGTKLAKGTVSRWENGKQEPMISTVALIAKTLRVSPLYLVGEIDDPEPHFIHTNVNSAVAQGANATAIWNGGTDGISPQEAELLRIFRGLNVRKQTELLSYAFSMEEKNVD